jgi:KipI family sensor histidine kinase inhibitor
MWLTRRVNIRRFGRDHLLVELDDERHALALYDEARRRGIAASDIVPAARTVLFDRVADVAALEASMPDWELTVSHAAGETVDVPTRYDGADLDEVAGLWDMTRAEVVQTHTSTEFVVAFCGFAPGFAYCTGLPQELSVPRLETPRAKVPAGSVGLAGPYTGVYPTASPGGWQLVGRTQLTLWDVDRDPPAPLVPGTRVRFVSA